MRLMIALVAGAIACGCEGKPPEQPAAPRGDPPPPPAGATLAGAALASSFAPELVGDVTPVVPTAGDYAMAITVAFDTFVTAELRITDHRKGALQLTLGPDGKAHACVGAIRHQVSAGQYHYERDPAKRKHSERTDSQLSALVGMWKVVDGVATITLDRYADGTCDASRASVVLERPTELRCVGVKATDLVPSGSLLCEAAEGSRLHELAIPMTEASRKAGDRYSRAAQTGRNVVLGAPGVFVEFRDTAQMPLPAITFRAGATPLVEADYVTPRRSP